MKKLFSKTIAFLTFVCIASLCLSSCSKNDDDNNGSNTVKSVRILAQVEYEMDQLEEELYGSDPMGMNSEEADSEYQQLLDDMRTSFRNDAKVAIEEDGGENGGLSLSAFTVDMITIEYPTIDENGNPTMLSGTLALGKVFGNYMTVKNLLLNLHPTAFNENMLTQASLTNRATDGLAVLEPHYQGFGTTAGKPQTYLCQKLIGRQCADMIPAAMQIIQQLGITVAPSLGTYITGYSQGGGNAMATARYLQEEAPDSLRQLANVKKVNCGAGPYNPYATFYHWLSSDTVSLSVVLPLVVKGMITGHPDIMAGIDIYSYFSDLYLSSGVVQAIDNNDGSMGIKVDGTDALAPLRYGSAGIMQYYMRFSGIMSDEVANPNSHIRTALEQCLTNEIVDDWTPQHPVEIFSSTDDNVIPYSANALATYNNFRAKGVDVKLTNSLINADHIISQFEWLADINLNKTYK